MALISTRPSEQPTINLLPTDIQKAQRGKRAFTLAAMISGLLIGIVIIISIVQQLQIRGEESTLRDEQAKAASLRSQIEGLRDIEALKASVDSNRLTLAAALVGDINWAKFLDEVDENIPSNSWLSSLSVNNTPGTTALDEPGLGNVQYSALVVTFPGLADWLDKMESVEGQRFVYMSSGTEDEDSKVVTFSATSFLTEVMASGRCQTETAKCP
jgi:Tfp pilus assembly protein PilN